MKKFLFLLIVGISLIIAGCTMDNAPQPTSSSGVHQDDIAVKTDINGKTSEQLNIEGKYLNDNIPGAVKYLYVISSYTGDILIYSTVSGKVTSSTKRLHPSTITTDSEHWGIPITINGEEYHTNEVIGDDGTYGGSGDYLYWKDTKGVFHQQYTAGAIIHISDQPLVTKPAVLNLDLQK